MTNWGFIPKDLAVMILELLEFHEDFMAFTGVCTRWRSAAKEAKFRACVPCKSLPWSSSSSSLTLPHDHHELPWLIAADKSDDHDLSLHKCRLIYSLCHRTMYHLDLPPSPCYTGYLKNEQEQAILSSHGWLLALTKEGHRELNLSLINPFSRAQIQLPTPEFWDHASEEVRPFVHYVGAYEKFILSGSPSSVMSTSHDDDDDYSVALILQEPYPNLSMQYEIVTSWKKGDDHWVQLGALNDDKGWPFLHLCSDITFYRGEFYAVDNRGNLLAFQPAQCLPRLVAAFADQGLFSSSYSNRIYHKRTIFYLVESIGRLLLLCRVKILIDDHYQTIFFQVFEVNVENGDAKEVHNLGAPGNSRAVFVEASSSFSVKASPSHGCKPNCIYYTHDYRNLYYRAAARCNGGGKDSGVYNLTTGKVESCSYGSLCVTDSTLPPISTSPMWLESPAS